MRAYWYDNVAGDQRLPHDSGRDVDEALLKEIGVLYYRMPAMEGVDALARDRDYKNRDEIVVSPEKMGAVYESKVRMFFDEHLHEDEEIRYIRDGRGYFDVRSKGDEWVRIQLEKDDLIILPAGIYHRFTTDEDNYIQAMRLFKDEPKWTPLNRCGEVDENEFRKAYVHEFVDKFAAASPGSVNVHRGKLMLPASCEPPLPNSPRKQLVWIVFGGTGHMGRSLVKCALARNDLVTDVGRTFETSPEAMDRVGAQNQNYLGMLCDVRAQPSVAGVVDKTLERFGRIDVIANCSGYGVIGACEDQDEHEIRNQFETNFMGTLHIIQASLPYFRSQGAGRYLIFSSTSGALGVPGLGPYCATKYAVEGLIEAMSYEIDSFNVKATLVEPGLVRRDEPDSVANPLPTWGHFLIKPASEAYAHATSPALHAKRMVQWLGDRQPTSAVKCAELVWQLAHCSYPPLRLVLGSYAIESIRDRLRSVTEELEDWKHLNYPAAPDADANAAAQAAENKPPEREDDAEDTSMSMDVEAQGHTT
ncbi:family-domain-containing protein [Nemania sp. FL0916]|nr:family-domain-containing protein [Nemania sp. FL0916]